MDLSRNQMVMVGAGLVVAAVLLGLGLRAVVGDDDGAGDETGTAVTVPSDDGEGDESDADSDDDSSATTDPDDPGDDSDQDETSSTTESTETSSTTSEAAEPTFVELSGLTLTRTGECPSLTVAVDSIINIQSGGDSTNFMFPDDGTLLEGTVTERSTFELGEEVAASVGDDWTISVFSREHLVEGAYSANHSSPGSASGRYPGQGGMQVAYEIAESNGQVTVSPLELSVSPWCQTVAPTVVINFSSSDGSEAADNGLTSQRPAEFGQPISLLDPVRFDLVDGWTMSVFVRDDFSGRSLSMTHDAPAEVTEVLAATSAGDPELTVSYSVAIG